MKEWEDMVEAPARPARLIADLVETSVQEFAAGLRGEALTPGDEGYDEARVIFNAMHDRKPGMIVKATGTADVVDCVRFAAANGLLLAIRSGGHSIAATSSVEGGLVIDLTEMNDVHVDPSTRIARVGGGATWGAVDRETQLYGLATPGGLVSTTGVAGLTLGGGISWLRSKYGLSCDAMRSAEVVTANGEVLTASATENADLFWALRGGGGNFGVVTSFEFELYPIGPVVQAVIRIYPLSKAPEAYRAWREYAATAPDEVTTATPMWTVPADPPAFPSEVVGEDVLFVAAVYAGPPEEGERVLGSVPDVGGALADLSGPFPYRALQAAFDPYIGQHGQHIGYWKSTYVRELSDEVIDIIVRRANERPNPWVIVNIVHVGGAAARVGATESAFGDRSAPFMISIDGLWQDPAENAANTAWVRDFWDELQPHATGQIYANFLGAEEDDLAEQAAVDGIYGSNLERLINVKTKYDPQNLFHVNQNVRPRA